MFRDSHMRTMLLKLSFQRTLEDILRLPVTFPGDRR